MQAVTEERDVEVDEETDAETGDSQVGSQLREMHWQDPFDGFQLDDQLIFYDDIEPILGVDRRALIDDRHADLTYERQVTRVELVAQAVLINRSSNPGPRCRCTSIHAPITASDNGTSGRAIERLS